MDKAAYRQLFLKHYVLLIGIPIVSVYLGLKVENIEANRMSRFRDKSALYGRELAPGEPPSWP